MNMTNGRPSSVPLFMSNYERAFISLEKGMAADEKERHEIAVEQYREGIHYANEALKYKFTPAEMPSVAPMRAKLLEHHKMFTSRLNELESNILGARNTRPKSQQITQSSGLLNGFVSFFTGASNPNSIPIDVEEEYEKSQPQVHQQPPRQSNLPPSMQFTRPKSTPTTSAANQTKKTPNKTLDWSKSPELRGMDKKMLDLILNEVVEQKPNVDWDSIAGLKEAKESLFEAVILPSLRPDLFGGLRSPAKGVLLFGPPGNGKTLLARAVASQSKCTFFSISASSIVGKYHGESEKMVKALFALARYLSPSVVFVDEIDSVLSSRSSEEHEASRRMKTEFLKQMDGIVSNSSEGQEYRVLLMGATNRPFDLDDAILRRFQKRVYIPLPDSEARKSLVVTLLKQINNVRIGARDLDRIVSMTEGFSGSDLYNLCQDVSFAPLRELSHEVLLHVNKNDLRAIQASDFEIGVRRVRPSTNQKITQELVEWNKKYGTFS
ncbi:P-loop containing nucleoside triphosphate hydrolase [Acrasis kona]|uniref:microtubule-severing ATPase n=1 Tax=Acrasis kona TaxID=1008807 RepID=A0AAW2YJ14_9EUKA